MKLQRNSREAYLFPGGEKTTDNKETRAHSPGPQVPHLYGNHSSSSSCSSFLLFIFFFAFAFVVFVVFFWFRSYCTLRQVYLCTLLRCKIGQHIPVRSGKAKWPVIYKQVFIAKACRHSQVLIGTTTGENMIRKPFIKRVTWNASILHPLILDKLPNYNAPILFKRNTLQVIPGCENLAFKCPQHVVGSNLYNGSSASGVSFVRGG